MSLHSQIRCEYGQNSVKLVRDYEKTATKVARYRNHLRFNLHCKHHDVIPTSLRLQSNVRGRKADKILRRAERQLLGIRIGDTVRKLKYLEEKKADFEEDVSRRLPGKSRDVIKFVGESQMRAHNGSKQSQRNKFTRLVEKKRRNQRDKKKDWQERSCQDG